MSREQRRQQSRGNKSGSGPPNRRTPVPAPGGGGVPWTPILIVGGAVLLIGLIVYLVLQSTGSDNGVSAATKAEQDSSASLPGTFVASQGRGHFNYTFSLEHTPLPFCEGVKWFGAPEGQPGSQTPSANTTPATTTTPVPTGTSIPSAGITATATVNSTGGTPSAAKINCYDSNPPSSGQHLGVQRNVDVTGNGDLINIPADPDVYPSDVEIPREAIPHILEHAGVYVGWNCAEGDQACADTVSKMEDLVNDRIDNHNDRVVMAKDSDLPEGYIGISSWTRFMYMPHTEYDQDTWEQFISDHACRFDPEGFC